MALERRAHTRPSPAVRKRSPGAGVGGLVPPSLPGDPPGGYAATSRRAAAVSAEAQGEGPGGAAAGADLGGSSKYSNENFEGRSGEGFHVNSS